MKNAIIITILLVTLITTGCSENNQQLENSQELIVGCWEEGEVEMIFSENGTLTTNIWDEKTFEEIKFTYELKNNQLITKDEMGQEHKGTTVEFPEKNKMTLTNEEGDEGIMIRCKESDEENMIIGCWETNIAGTDMTMTYTTNNKIILEDMNKTISRTIEYRIKGNNLITIEEGTAIVPAIIVFETENKAIVRSGSRETILVKCQQ